MGPCEVLAEVLALASCFGVTAGVGVRSLDGLPLDWWDDEEAEGALDWGTCEEEEAPGVFLVRYSVPYQRS